MENIVKLRNKKGSFIVLSLLFLLPLACTNKEIPENAKVQQIDQETAKKVETALKNSESIEELKKELEQLKNLTEAQKKEILDSKQQPPNPTSNVASSTPSPISSIISSPNVPVSSPAVTPKPTQTTPTPKPVSTGTPKPPTTPTPSPTPSTSEIIKSGPEIPGMVFVVGGTFTIGDASIAPPAHQVTVSSFYIGKYEVKQQEYQSLIGNNPANYKGDNQPVETVTWFDAIKYCNALSKKENIAVAYNETTGVLLDGSGDVTTDVTKVKGYRLPTEAEWEFAAKGGNNSKKTTYSGSSNLDSVAWYESNSFSSSHDVGTKSANELGLYDMSGNVWEWTTDWYGSYTANAVTNPYISSSSSDKRVYRGGGWNSLTASLPVTVRQVMIPDESLDRLGLRVCRTVM